MQQQITAHAGSHGHGAEGAGVGETEGMPEVVARAAPAGWRDHSVCTFDGKYDTNIKSGRDYRTRTLVDIFVAAGEPAARSKTSAPAIIPSAYHAFDGREHEVQEERGQFVAVCTDVDKGDVDPAKLDRLYAEFWGDDVALLRYSTASSTPEARRWRLITPIAKSMQFREWAELSNAWFDFLEHHGVPVDRGLSRAGQPVFLPNVPPAGRQGQRAHGRPDFYEYRTADGVGAVVTPTAHAWIDKLRVREAADRAAAEAARAEAAERRARRRAERGDDADVSVIDAFNAKHTVEELLGEHGYEEGGNGNWRSRYQTSGSFATRVYDSEDGQHWVSLSGSDAQAGLGAPSRNGARFGDAFDLYVHYAHEGNYVGAVRAAARELGLDTVAPQAGASHTDLVNAIDGALLTENEPVAIVRTVMPAMAESVGLTPAEVDDLLKRLKVGTGLTIKALRDELARHRQQDPDADSGMVSVKWPVPTARAFLTGFYTGPDGVLTLRHWQDQFYAWIGSRYAPLSTADVRAQIYRLFKQNAVSPPGRSVIDNVVDALKGLTNVPSRTSMPAWLDEAPPALLDELMAVGNGLLHMPTKRLLPHDPRHFAVDAAPVCYDPAARIPTTWLKFLSDAFPGDQESVECLQQWMGYLIAGDTSQQKALIAVGPPRSGKGTVARVLRALVGEHAYAGPSLGQLGQRFGLQGLINAKVAVVSDARVSGTADVLQIGENILRISGEDAISVERKGITDWVGRLRVRFVLLTNVLPGIVDGGGAVASRFIVLRFGQSFLGREDPKLTDKLLAELPGILNWAMEGLEALRSRGAFVQPASGLEAVEELKRRTTPLLGFISDSLVFDSEAWVDKDTLYDAYREWCGREGMKHTLQKPAFVSELYAISDGRLASHRPRVRAGGITRRLYAVKGARLLDELAAQSMAVRYEEVADDTAA